ncbi:MAG: glycosyltransferase family 2 protein [Firmicutes bacterium]|nr:glycosyltransferase family 2 protein [Bacillota bacterium]
MGKAGDVMERISQVSVIMPTYNCACTVEASIRSVLAQTMPDWELLVVDDGSSDETPELIQQMSRADTRVKAFLKAENHGVARARNDGLDWATGKYIAFLDSDDLWEPNKLARQLKVLAETQADLCYTAYDFIGPQGEIVGRQYQVPQKVTYAELLSENVVGLSTVLLRRNALGSLRFEEQWFHEDFSLWLRLLRMGRAFYGISDILTHYRTGGRSSNKLLAAKHRWRILREGEQIPFWSSLVYMFRYGVASARKYLR